MALTEVKEYNKGYMNTLKTCTVTGCESPYIARGYCNAHYLRQKRHDSLEKTTIYRGGNTKHPLYLTYRNMLQRCNYLGAKQYADYGGRGITVCERWDSEDGFTRFIEDMGVKPSPAHTLDRKDNNKGYSPDNCKWSTRSEQQRNQRTRSDNRTGVTGVSYRPSYGNYQARIKIDGKYISLGCYPTVEQATLARQEAEIKYLKEN